MKKGFSVLLVLFLTLVLAALFMAVSLRVGNLVRSINLREIKMNLKATAGNVLFLIASKIRNDYIDNIDNNGNYDFDLSAFDEVVSPPWIEDFLDKVTTNQTLEGISWSEAVSSFDLNTCYVPKSDLQNLINSLYENVSVCLFQHKYISNFLLCITRSEKGNFVSYSWGFITPKYYSNWAVFSLEGVGEGGSNYYYAWGERIDGPSFFGYPHNLNVLGDISPIPPGSTLPPDAIGTGPFFNGRVVTTGLIYKVSGTRNEATYRIEFDSDEDGEYEDVFSTPYYYSYSLETNDTPLWVYKVSDGQVEEVIYAYPGNYEIDRINKVIRINKGIKYEDLSPDLFPFTFASGGDIISRDDWETIKRLDFEKKEEYYEEIDEQASLLVFPQDSGKLDDPDTIDPSQGYGIRFQGQKLKVYFDVLKVEEIKTRDGEDLEFPGLSEDATCSYIEIEYPSNEPNKALIIVIPESSLKDQEGNPLPYPWDAFIYEKNKKGKNWSLVYDNPIPFKFNGLIMNIHGGSGSSQGEGEAIEIGYGIKDEHVARIMGRFTLVSRGSIEIYGDLIYDGVYNKLNELGLLDESKSIPEYLNEHGEAGRNILNELVSETNTIDMLNVVSLRRDITLMIAKNDEETEDYTKNVKLFGNFFCFGGKFAVQHPDVNKGYRHVFGSITARELTYTFTGSYDDWQGWKEYNVYDDRLYNNTLLPFGTPQMREIIILSFRVM